MGLPPPVVHVNTRLGARGEREIHTWDISSQPAGTSPVQRRCSRGVCEIGGRFPPADSSSCSLKDRNSLSLQNIFLVLIVFVSYGKAQLFHRLLLVVVSGGSSRRAHSLPPLLNFLFALHWCLEITVQRNALPPLYCSFIYCRGGGAEKSLCHFWPQAGVTQRSAGEDSPVGGKACGSPRCCPASRKVRFVACALTNFHRAVLQEQFSITSSPFVMFARSLSFPFEP